MKKKCFIIILIIAIMIFLPTISVEAIQKVNCGNLTNIPKKIPDITNLIMNVIWVITPVVLVIMGMIDLFKGITAQKEDEIKKGQKTLIKRLILAAIIFFVIVITKFVISMVADASTVSIIDCIDCFVNDSSTCEPV